MTTHEKRLTLSQLFTKDRNMYTHMILNYENPGVHGHEFIEFFYVLDGECTHYLDGKTQHIACGDAFLLTPRNVHQFYPLGRSFMHRDVIFKTDYFRNVCNVYSPHMYDMFVSDSFSKQVTLSNQQINYLESLVQPRAENAQSGIFDGVVCTYILNIFAEKNLQPNAVGYPAWISRLLSLLSAPENFRTDQTVILSAFSYSREYICRTFKKNIGKTVTDYFNEQKMKYAYNLLQSSTYSVEQICERINFKSIPYFYRLFKEHFHITPREVIPPPENSASAT